MEKKNKPIALSLKAKNELEKAMNVITSKYNLDKNVIKTIESELTGAIVRVFNTENWRELVRYQEATIRLLLPKTI